MRPWNSKVFESFLMLSFSTEYFKLGLTYTNDRIRKKKPLWKILKSYEISIRSFKVSIQNFMFNFEASNQNFIPNFKVSNQTLEI